MSVELIRRRFTVDNYHCMAESGILTKEDRVELIDGEIVEMAPIGSRHQACVDRLTELFSSPLARRALLRVQGPIHLDGHSEPQPDLALLQRRDDFYATAHPTPQDILLLAEVADTSAQYNREVKMQLYNRYHLSEVWLIDLERDVIEVYQDPSPAGYQTSHSWRRGQGLAPLAFPDIELTIDAILG